MSTALLVIPIAVLALVVGLALEVAIGAVGGWPATPRLALLGVLLGVVVSVWGGAWVVRMRWRIKDAE